MKTLCKYRILIFNIKATSPLVLYKIKEWMKIVITGWIVFMFSWQLKDLIFFCKWLKVTHFCSKAPQLICQVTHSTQLLTDLVLLRWQFTLLGKKGQKQSSIYYTLVLWLSATQKLKKKGKEKVVCILWLEDLRRFWNFMIGTREFLCCSFSGLNHIMTVFSSTKFFSFNIVMPKFAMMTAWSCKLSFSVL